MLYYSNYMTFWKRQNYGNNKMINDCGSLFKMEGKGEGEAQKIIKTGKIHCVVLY